MLADKNGFYTITNCDVIETFFDVTKDYDKQEYAKKYNLTRFKTFEEGRQHWFGNASTGNMLYEYYYNYTIGKEYYYLTSDSNSDLIPLSSSNYGTGWDKKSGSTNNYWLIWEEASAIRIYSRWKSFF